MIDKHKVKQTKDELKALGFKEKKYHLGGKIYNYDTKQTFSLYVRIHPDDQYCAAQMCIDTNGHIFMHFNYDTQTPLHINFDQNNFNSIVSVAKKSIKIVDNLNKKLSQIDADVEKFNDLV